MSELAVRTEDVWKRFRIYHDRTLSLKERLIFWNRQEHASVWALKGVSLEVPRGSTLALIGRNGSGKSTLLKVISRILYPTQGSIRVTGRLSTLLELGAGFHPDFSGRENIYLNGSILGLTRRQVKERFEGIVSFSELGRFIDSPVRTYSSGMYMRLGFSIAIHVDPDILLVDEVLAVGDLPFQQKCRARIQDLQRMGKTIILVTHDLRVVRELCSTAAWLDAGTVRMLGPSTEVADAYERAVGVPVGQGGP